MTLGEFRSHIAGNEWPAISDPNAGLLVSLLYQLEKSEWWSPDILRQHQFGQLNHVIRHAAATVPFYRDRFAHSGIDPGVSVDETFWKTLPQLTRIDIQSAKESLYSTAMPASHGKITSLTTSGSTGTPVTIKGTAVTQIYWYAFLVRDQYWRKLDYSKKFAAIRYVHSGGGFYPGNIRPNWGQGPASIFKTGTMHVLNILTPVEQQIRWLEEVRPDYLLTYPSNLMEMIRFSKEHGTPPVPLRGIECFGEVLFPEIRSACAEWWGISPADMYTSQEVGYIALQCPDCENYHVQSENVLVEVVDDNDRACAPGETGHVVVTTLHNFAMPLIRYRVGDLATVGDACSCGRGLPVLTRITGRVRNMLTLPSGARLWPYFGANKLLSVVPVRQFQLVQKSLSELELRVVPARPFTAEDEAKARDLILSQLGHKFQIAFTYHDEIPRGAGGKYEDFKSELPT